MVREKDQYIDEQAAQLVKCRAKGGEDQAPWGMMSASGRALEHHRGLCLLGQESNQRLDTYLLVI
jgi:hypothetical protein